MSAEHRAALSETMKQRWAERKAKKADPAVKEAMANTPLTGVAQPVVDRWTGERLPDVNKLRQKITANRKYEIEHPSSINIDVDWEHLPMQEAQQFYAHLKSEFEKAGRILNARSMARIEGYDCFMCHNHFDGNPRFTDHSYMDASGLNPRVDICGELCVINYNAFRINERRERELKQAAVARGQ
jgi:hypothetical protein